MESRIKSYEVVLNTSTDDKNEVELLISLLKDCDCLITSKIELNESGKPKVTVGANLYSPHFLTLRLLNNFKAFEMKEL